MRLLLDTHVWFWSLTEPRRLGRRVRAELARSGNELWLSPISVWELLALSEKGRIRLVGEPRAWLSEAFARAPVAEAVLNHEVAMRSREVMPAHADPADRFLVATALTYDLTLATADRTIIDARVCPTLASG